MAEGDTLVNAVIGAVVSVVLTPFVPFAPLLGGAVAGYLQGGDRSEGLRVGAISGVVALVPALLIGLVFLGIALSVVAGGLVAGAPPVFGLFGAFGLVGVLAFGLFGVVYVVGLSAAGGWLGNYVKGDTDIEV